MTRVDHPTLFKQFRETLRQNFGKSVKCQLKVYKSLAIGKNEAVVEVSLDNEAAIEPIAKQVYGDAFKQIWHGGDKWPVVISVKGCI